MYNVALGDKAFVPEGFNLSREFAYSIQAAGPTCEPSFFRGVNPEVSSIGDFHSGRTADFYCGERQYPKPVVNLVIERREAVLLRMRCKRSSEPDMVSRTQE